MIRPKVCFAAFAIVRDVETSGISAFNILEGIIPSALPAFLQQAGFVVLWEREANDPAELRGEFTLELAGVNLIRSQVAVNFQHGLLHRSIVNIQGVVIPRPGQLKFSIVLDGGARAEYTVEVQAPPVIVQAAQPV